MGFHRAVVSNDLGPKPQNAHRHGACHANVGTWYRQGYLLNRLKKKNIAPLGGEGKSYWNKK